MQANCLTIGKAILMQGQYRKYTCAGPRRHGTGGTVGSSTYPVFHSTKFILKRVALSQLRDGQPSRLGKGVFELRKCNRMNNFREERENASVDVN